MGGSRLSQRKSIVVPSLKRDIFPSIACIRPPAGGVAWQSTSDGENSYLLWAAQQRRGRSRCARRNPRCRLSAHLLLAISAQKSFGGSFVKDCAISAMSRDKTFDLNFDQQKDRST